MMRTIMIDCTKCGEVKDVSNFTRDARRTRGYGSYCKDCQNAIGRKSRKENPAAKRLATQKYYAANKEKLKAARVGYTERNAEALRAYRAAYYAATRDSQIAYQRAYQKANPEAVSAYVASRAARKIRATPAWADLEAIERVYAAAAQMTAETGVAHHVDHTVPLRSRLVCGLHVHANLQILTAEENIRKGNRWWPDMP
jgi:hypothetical protein